jgi:hypothetical protein
VNLQGWKVLCTTVMIFIGHLDLRKPNLLFGKLIISVLFDILLWCVQSVLEGLSL